MTKRRSPAARSRIRIENREGRRLTPEGQMHEHVTRADRDRGGKVTGHHEEVVMWSATKRPPTDVRAERRKKGKAQRAARKRNRG